MNKLLKINYVSYKYILKGYPFDNVCQIKLKVISNLMVNTLIKAHLSAWLKKKKVVGKIDCSINFQTFNLILLIPVIRIKFHQIEDSPSIIQSINKLIFIF